MPCLNSTTILGSSIPVTGMTPGTGGLKYYKEYGPDTFTSADAKCQSSGLKLATIYTSQEYSDIISNFISKFAIHRETGMCKRTEEQTPLIIIQAVRAMRLG